MSSVGPLSLGFRSDEIVIKSRNHSRLKRCTALVDIKRKTCNFYHQVGGFVDKFKEGSDNVRDQIENAGEQIDRFCLKVGHS